MPELPEVETVRRSLAAVLVGRRVERVEVRETRLRAPVDPWRLRRRVAGRRVEAIGRRSKYLLLELEGGNVLLVHLGMSGRLYVAERGDPLEPHVHVRLYLDDGRHLRFRDPRRFGLLEALGAGDLAQDPRLRDLGLEPLSETFTGAALHALSRGSRMPVKNFLMDARRICGVGNIYASESLFVAGVHPCRAAGRVSRERWQRLAESVRHVLLQAIEQGGTTINDFRDGRARSGQFQDHLQVYGHAGSACPRCATPIRARVLAGRSTFYCPRCQH